MTTAVTHAVFGFSKNSLWAFTQGMTDGGALASNQISSASWGGAWPALTAVNTVDGDTPHGFVLGCGTSDKQVFIQAITNYGALGIETFRTTMTTVYSCCCSYQTGGQTYVLLHSKSTKGFAIWSVTADGRLAATTTQEGSWGLGYDTLFTITAGGVLYLGGHSSSENKFFLQAINSDGKLAANNASTASWGDYYQTIIPVQAGDRAYIFAQTTNKKRWFTQEVLSNGQLASSEASSGSWGNFYATATSFTAGGVTYLMAQSSDDSKNYKWFTQIIGSDGKFAAQESASGSFLYFYSFLHVFTAPMQMSNDCWMTDLYEPILKNKKLKEIIMPGSHDAGMYQAVDCELVVPKYAVDYIKPDSGPYLTQTQSYNIYDQLMLGSRYFDLRPIAYTDSSGKLSYRIGHFSSFGEYHAGCYGGNLNDILDEVIKFANDSNRCHELVMLKFSHYMSDAKGDFSGSWSVQQKSDFSTYLTGKLKGWLITYSGDGKIGQLTYQQLMAQGGNPAGAKVLLLLEGIGETVRSPSRGIFRYSDYPYDDADPDFVSPHVDFTVYDHYSNTENLNSMIGNQCSKMSNPDNHKGDMFLLSWTLTQQIPPGGSISQLANKANEALPGTLEKWVADKVITKDTLPNIIFVDYLTTMEGDLTRELLRQIYG